MAIFSLEPHSCHFKRRTRKPLPIDHRLGPFSVGLLLLALSGTAHAEDDPEKNRTQPEPGSIETGLAADVSLVSKYLWRGQRLTDDWSLQPSGTLVLGRFSFNLWGNLDLKAVNEGDALFLPENPSAPAGSHDGLQGKFSEVDFTFGFEHSLTNLVLEGGTILYTFPERSASLPSTLEIYGRAIFDRLPLNPSLALYVDVDETLEGESAGLYFVLSGGRLIPFRHPTLRGLEISGSLAFVNAGFSQYYYGDSISGAHDATVSFSLPVQAGENWGASVFVTYSALLGDFRNFQFVDPRRVYRGTAGSPATAADSVWGGVSFSFDF